MEQITLLVQTTKPWLEQTIVLDSIPSIKLHLIINVFLFLFIVGLSLASSDLVSIKTLNELLQDRLLLFSTTFENISQAHASKRILTENALDYYLSTLYLDNNSTSESSNLMSETIDCEFNARKFKNGTLL